MRLKVLTRATSHDCSSKMPKHPLFGRQSLQLAEMLSARRLRARQRYLHHNPCNNVQENGN